MIARWSLPARLILVVASGAAGLAAWAIEVRGDAPSLGLFTFVSPPVVLAIWMAFSNRAERRADARALARLLALLVAVAVFTPLLAGARPRPIPTLGAALLQLAVLAPLILCARILGGHLGRRLGPRRSGRLAAAALGEAVPAILWLPVMMLAFTVHRAPASVLPEDLGVDWPRERLDISGAGGTRLSALWFPHPRARGAVLLIHGIGADKAQFLLSAEILYQRGYHVLTYDQRNHGESGGLTSTLGAVESEDVIAAFQVLRERTRGADHPRLVLGVSMGGAAAGLALGKLDGLDGLILDSTFADIEHVAARRLPLGPLTAPALAVARAFAVPLTGRAVLDVRPVSLAANAPAGLPVLILHGRADPLIPLGEAEALARAHGPRATLVALDGPGHAQGLLHDGVRYREAILDWLSRVEARAKAP